VDEPFALIAAGAATVLVHELERTTTALMLVIPPCALIVAYLYWNTAFTAEP
jgi:hypothetical protein